MSDSISQETVLRGYYLKGFRLKEPDDHTLELWYRGERFGMFSASSMTTESLRAICGEYLSKHARERDSELAAQGWKPLS